MDTCAESSPGRQEAVAVLVKASQKKSRKENKKRKATSPSTRSRAGDLSVTRARTITAERDKPTTPWTVIVEMFKKDVIKDN